MCRPVWERGGRQVGEIPTSDAFYTHTHTHTQITQELTSSYRKEGRERDSARETKEKMREKGEGEWLRRVRICSIERETCVQWKGKQRGRKIDRGGTKLGSPKTFGFTEREKIRELGLSLSLATDCMYTGRGKWMGESGRGGPHNTPQLSLHQTVPVDGHCVQNCEVRFFMWTFLKIN